jgi:ABC-type glycerol-3-phosphate transport system permease component
MLLWLLALLLTPPTGMILPKCIIMNNIGLIVTTLPPAILFVMFRRLFVRGLTFGAVAG